METHKREVDALRQMVSDLKRENNELRQQKAELMAEVDRAETKGALEVSTSSSTELI